jgi:hypothetical protein
LGAKNPCSVYFILLETNFEPFFTIFELLKKIITYIAISFYLLGTTEASELLKLGNFISHYIEHKNADNLSILDFINIHYVKATVVDDDFKEDQKLPFKSHNDCKLIIAQVDKIHNNDYCIVTPYVETNNQVTQYHSPLLGDQFLEEIFQPPKFRNS